MASKTVNIAAVVSLIVGLYSIINTGMLAPLNAYKIFSFTLVQTLYIMIVGIGFGIILADLVGGKILVQDAKERSAEFLSNIGGISETEAEQLMQSIAIKGAGQALDKAKLSSKPNSKKVASATVSDSPVQAAINATLLSSKEEFPSVELLVAELRRQNLSDRMVLATTIASVADMTSSSDITQKLPVAEVKCEGPSPLSPKHLMPMEKYNLKALASLLVLIGIIVAIRLFVIYVPPFSI